MIYGFVYIWMDVKRKMFYIGSHMGTLDDGYIGSNTRLKRAYKKRPLDFKRRILSFCTENSKSILQTKEERWLKMIKIEELGIKYYNLKRVAAGGNLMENYTEEQKILYRQKLRDSANTGKNHHNARKVVCFGKIYDTMTEAKKAIGFHPQRRLTDRKYPDFYFLDEGPLTDLEIEAEKKRKAVVREECIQARSAGISAMPKEKQKEKALKAAKTRALTCPNIGDKISEGLKNRPGRKVSIDGIIYDKGRIAAEKLGMIYGTVKVRLRSKSFPNWFYLDDPIKNPST